MGHWWVYTIVFVLLAALSFIMAPPTWLVNRFVRRFSLHPTLQSDQVTVSTDNHLVTGELRDRIVRDFDAAIFLNRFDILPRHADKPSITIETRHRGKSVVYSLYPNSPHVDVIRTGLGKPVGYRIDSSALLRRLSRDSAAAEF